MSAKTSSRARSCGIHQYRYISTYQNVYFSVEKLTNYIVRFQSGLLRCAPIIITLQIVDDSRMGYHRDIHKLVFGYTCLVPGIKIDENWKLEKVQLQSANLCALCSKPGYIWLTTPGSRVTGFSLIKIVLLDACIVMTLVQTQQRHFQLSCACEMSESHNELHCVQTVLPGNLYSCCL